MLDAHMSKCHLFHYLIKLYGTAANVHHGVEINRSKSLKTIPIHYHYVTETNNRYPGTQVSIWNKHSTVAITRTDCCEKVRIQYLNEIRSKSFTQLSSRAIPSYIETFFTVNPLTRRCPRVQFLKD